MTELDRGLEPDEWASEDLAPPPAVRLPLDAWHRARGGRMVEFAGYWLPVQYDGIIAEHLWTRERAGLFDISHMGQLTVSGARGGMGDAEAALERLLPADLASLKIGGLRYSLLLDQNGGILDDLIVARSPDAFQLVVNGATKWDDIAHLREHLPDDITLSHRDEQALLALQGPEAAAVMGALGTVPASPGMLCVQALGFMQTGAYLWQGRPLGISRSGYTGEDGFEITVHGEDAVALADALTAFPAVKPIGLGARDSLRLEAGLPLYGHDLGPGTDPISAGLDFAINKRRRREGGFAGAGRVLALLADGPPHRRVGLVLTGGMAAREGARIYAGDVDVGHLTSGGFSPSCNRPIAMGYVAEAYAAPGTALAIAMRGKHLAAHIVSLPFVPHRYFRIGTTS